MRGGGGGGHCAAMICLNKCACVRVEGRVPCPFIFAYEMEFSLTSGSASSVQKKEYAKITTSSVHKKYTWKSLHHQYTKGVRKNHYVKFGRPFDSRLAASFEILSQISVILFPHQCACYTQVRYARILHACISVTFKVKLRSAYHVQINTPRAEPCTHGSPRSDTDHERDLCTGGQSSRRASTPLHFTATCY